MTRLATTVAAAILLASGILGTVIAPLRASAHPQAVARDDAARLTFEVASIKENRSGQIFETFFYQYPTSGRVIVINNSARTIIQMAYGLPTYRLSGGPKWLDETRFDIQAKAVGPATTAQLMQMLRALLEERFMLAMAEDRREDNVLALVQMTPGRLGPNISPAMSDDRRMFPVGLRSPGETQGSAATMADLAAYLATRMGRHVIDRTGLAGIYNFTIKSGGGGPRRGGPPVPPPEALQALKDDLPSLTTALQEQLGLKLESQRGVVPFYVIKRVEKPSVDGISMTAEPVTAELPAR